MIRRGNVKSLTRIFVIVIVFSIMFTFVMTPNEAKAVNNCTIGAWYSTWYSKVPQINTTWITGFGISSNAQFVGDCNGDGKDDAVVFFGSTGAWNVALSNGNGFNAGSVWKTGHGIGSSKQFLADVNGDGKMDAIVYFSGTGSWYVSTSNGSGFNNYSLWKSGFGGSSSNQLLADVNGDGKADAIAFSNSNGSWDVAISSGTSFGNSSQWITGHGVGSSKQFAGDINGDGKADSVVYFSSNGNWYAAYSTGSAFSSYFTWIQGHGVGSSNQLLTDSNADGMADAYIFFPAGTGDFAGDWHVTQASGSGTLSLGCFNDNFGASSSNQLVGDVSDRGDKGWKESVAFYSSTGTWEVQRYRATKTNLYDLWTAWNIKYVPYTLGSYQTYDSGDASVIDEHLAMLAEAKIDFIIMDETNHLYVDDGFIISRAKKVAERIRIWNSNPSNRPIKYAIAIGGIQWSHDPNEIEWESNEVWNQFVNTPAGGMGNYFYLDGKPLIITYCTQADRNTWVSWAGDKTSSNRYTVRWAHSPAIAGTYGWEVRNGAIDDNEVMVVMPGWNNNKGAPPVSRQNGDYYALSCWDRVLAKASAPEIVVINSFNEYAEENAVAPADTSNVTSPTEKWYNKSGQIDNFMYWNMTKKFINALLGESY